MSDNHDNIVFEPTSFRVDKTKLKKIKMLCLDKDLKIQHVIDEALDDLLKKYGIDSSVNIGDS